MQGILINGQFPGPQIDSVTNDNLIINVFNSLDEPFLLSWLVLQFSLCEIMTFFRWELQVVLKFSACFSDLYSYILFLVFEFLTML